MSLDTITNILNDAFKKASVEAANNNMSVLHFLENRYPSPENSEVPFVIPEHLQDEWVYSLSRSWGRAFRAVLLLVIYAGRVNDVNNCDIMAGRGYFDGDLHELRKAFGFFEN